MIAEICEAVSDKAYQCYSPQILRFQDLGFATSQVAR
jgi:hypothetical protein